MSNSEPYPEKLVSAYGKLRTKPELALDELEALHDVGSPLAPLYLGWVYQKGELVGKDSRRAERYYRSALDRGNSISSYYLGHLLTEERRYEEASDVFRQGVLLDCLPSIFCFGANLLEGKGVVQNFEEAVSLLRLASSRGHAFATRTLATQYLLGRFGLLRLPYGIWLTAKSIFFAVSLSILSRDDERLKA